MKLPNRMGKAVVNDEKVAADIVRELSSRLMLNRKADALVDRSRTSGPPPIPPIDNSPDKGDDGGMESRITALETRLDTVLPTLATKADIGEIRADLHKVSGDIKGWTLATMVTIIGTMLAAIFGISQIFKGAITTPAAAPPAPAPIVIYAQPAPTPAPPPTQAPSK